MNLTELKIRRVKALDEMEALVALAQKESRDASVDEAKRFDELDAEIRKLDAQIVQAIRFEELKAERAKGTTEPIVAIQVTREEGTDDKGNCIVWGSMGEQLLAVKRLATEPHMPENRKLAEKIERSNRIMRAASGLQESVIADGGALVQTEFSTTLINKAMDTGKLGNLVQRYGITSGANGITFPYVDETSRATGSRAGGIRAYWEGEADQYLKSKPKIALREMKLKKLIGLCYMTEEVLEDAGILAQFVTNEFAREFGYMIDDAILFGDGAGKPLGILSSPASLVVVSKESGQAAGTLNALNIAKMYARLRESNLSSAAWVYNQSAKAQIMTLSLTVGSNTVPVMLPGTGGTSGNLADAPRTTILGSPAMALEQMETLGNQGDIALIDFSEYIWIDKGGIKSAQSVHVRFEYDEQAYKFTYRADGMPTVKQVLTPAKGSDTVSPYVTLQAR